MDSEYEWHDHWAPYFLGARLILIDGTTADRGAHVMRRRLPDGSWQYRKPTVSEQSDFRAAWDI
jgi:hypothetical protein